MSVPTPPASPDALLDPVQAAKIQQAMKTLKSTLSSIDSQLLADFPADLSFFLMVQARATSIETEVAALRRRRARVARKTDVSNILDQTQLDFDEATDMASAAQIQRRGDLSADIVGLRDELTDFIDTMP